VSILKNRAGTAEIFPILYGEIIINDDFKVFFEKGLTICRIA
jgi:hypothetical protein